MCPRSRGPNSRDSDPQLSYTGGGAAGIAFYSRPTGDGRDRPCAPRRKSCRPPLTPLRLLDPLADETAILGSAAHGAARRDRKRASGFAHLARPIKVSSMDQHAYLPLVEWIAAAGCRAARAGPAQGFCERVVPSGCRSAAGDRGRYAHPVLEGRVSNGSATAAARQESEDSRSDPESSAVKGCRARSTALRDRRHELPLPRQEVVEFRCPRSCGSGG